MPIAPLRALYFSNEISVKLLATGLPRLQAASGGSPIARSRRAAPKGARVTDDAAEDAPPLTGVTLNLEFVFDYRKPDLDAKAARDRHVTRRCRRI